MKVIVGLGNPGPKYAETRHNAGFAVIHELARRWSAEGKNDARFNAMLAETRVGFEKVLLVQPLTYMNLSGRSVQSLVNFYKVPVEELVVVSDDVDLPVGALRLRKKGSSGGQKGMQSIIDHLSSADFPRVRLGVGARPAQWQMEDWVLSRFAPEEQKEFDAAVVSAADAVELWVRRNDFDLAMNRYNTPKKSPPAEEQSRAPERSKGRNETTSAHSDRKGREAAAGVPGAPLAPQVCVQTEPEGTLPLEDSTRGNTPGHDSPATQDPADQAAAPVARPRSPADPT
jgi:PTH1 family peptidyl-tRNA hydrolase